MKSRRITLSRAIACSFFREHMHKHRTIHTLCLIKHTAHFLYITAIHRSQIDDAHLLKEHTRNKKLLYAALCIPDMLYHTLSVDWYMV